jgi:hypothetical protein
VIDKDDVDLLGTRKERSLDRRCRDALGALVLYPFDLEPKLARLERYSKNDLVLDHQPGDRLADHPRLNGKKSE